MENLNLDFEAKRAEMEAKRNAEREKMEAERAERMAKMAEEKAMYEANENAIAEQQKQDKIARLQARIDELNK